MGGTGKHSGRNALRTRLKELGYTDLLQEELDELFKRFKVPALLSMNFFIAPG